MNQNFYVPVAIGITVIHLPQQRYDLDKKMTPQEILTAALAEILCCGQVQMSKPKLECPKCGEKRDSRFIGIFCDTCGWHLGESKQEKESR